MLICPSACFSHSGPNSSTVPLAPRDNVLMGNNNNNNNGNCSITCGTNQGGIGGARAPRVISEIRKNNRHFRDLHIRPKISGEVLVLLGSDNRWFPRRVTVKAGQIFLGQVQHDNNNAKSNVNSAIRIPLRQLSLQAGSLANSFSLVRGQAILLTLQTSNERALDLWVKTIAIEIIRQTPLEYIKYLDILSLTIKENRCLLSNEPHKIECDRKADNDSHSCEYDINDNVVLLPPSSNNEKTTIERLLQKCQNNERYVPVKEKLMLFESLCRISRGFPDAADASARSVKERLNDKRTHSMHDLTYCFASGGGVREICKYFETKLEENVGSGGPTNHRYRIKRLVNSDSSLHRVAYSRNFENVSYA